ncbi:uncharacterized protein LTR77_003191 [Saxophila tyrrhenica]|uniref:N-acetyltransferase domain-containing protein n=1 Tax=Saxophila tyrrhenica TaxID=1690608 RepID=A0AAV9PGQ1_9PEZI|nr:hypothetical protein LTR77_003191 [Saxophila tyrrhenica]
MLRPLNRHSGDLCTPPISPLCWPVDPSDGHSALLRLQYSTANERAFFLRDPTAHPMKVCSAETGELMSYARWNFFPDGYDFERDECVDAEEFLPEEGRGVMRVELYRGLRQGMMRLRREWQPKGEGSWVLMSMVTRECWRGQGAAKLLIEWGLQRAREDGVPAYLEASVEGKPVYERHGFQQVGELVPWDMRPHGIDVTFDIAKMAYYPDSHEERSK